jgi:MerR family transcriptional regulator, light-induced transcriptional regulator
MTDAVRWGTADKPFIGFERLRALAEQRDVLPNVTKPERLEDLASVIETIIVPRLLMAHSIAAKPMTTLLETHREDVVIEFANLTTQDDPALATSFVQRLLDDGMVIEDVFMSVLAPAARYLGERWVNDTCSFVEVTLGVARMHRVLREFNGVPKHLWSRTGEGHNALLLPVPGEQHTFGLRLVEEFLLRESWSVRNHPVEKIEDLAPELEQTRYDVVGLSLSGETFIETLRETIAFIRRKSMNADTRIIVGGQIFAEKPGLVELCGADACAVDAPSAVRLANNWIARQMA